MKESPGGKYTFEARFAFSGDIAAARGRVGEARQVLGYLRDMRSLGGPLFMTHRVTLPDGTAIVGVMNNGQFSAQIFSPGGGGGEEVTTVEATWLDGISAVLFDPGSWKQVLRNPSLLPSNGQAGTSPTYWVDSGYTKTINNTFGGGGFTVVYDDKKYSMAVGTTQPRQVGFISGIGLVIAFDVSAGAAVQVSKVTLTPSTTPGGTGSIEVGSGIINLGVVKYCALSGNYIWTIVQTGLENVISCYGAVEGVIELLATKAVSTVNRSFFERVNLTTETAESTTSTTNAIRDIVAHSGKLSVAFYNESRTELFSGSSEFMTVAKPPVPAETTEFVGDTRIQVRYSYEWPEPEQHRLNSTNSYTRESSVTTQVFEFVDGVIEVSTAFEITSPLNTGSTSMSSEDLLLLRIVKNTTTVFWPSGVHISTVLEYTVVQAESHTLSPNVIPAEARTDYQVIHADGINGVYAIWTAEINMTSSDAPGGVTGTSQETTTLYLPFGPPIVSSAEFRPDGSEVGQAFGTGFAIGFGNGVDVMTESLSNSSSGSLQGYVKQGRVLSFDNSKRYLFGVPKIIPIIMNPDTIYYAVEVSASKTSIKDTQIVPFGSTSEDHRPLTLTKNIRKKE